MGRIAVVSRSFLDAARTDDFGRLQASPNLTAGWEELPPPWGTNAVGSYFIELAPAANRFVRLARGRRRLASVRPSRRPAPQEA